MLDALGIRNIARRGVEIAFSCPFPDHQFGDSNPSAAMNEETTAWNCKSCHRAGNAATFLAEFAGISELLARRYLRERYGSDFREPAGTFGHEIDEFFRTLRESSEVDRRAPTDADLERFAV